jgi:hypothetical protein
VGKKHIEFNDEAAEFNQQKSNSYHKHRIYRDYNQQLQKTKANIDIEEITCPFVNKAFSNSLS